MKIMANIRSTETQQVREIQAEAPTYDEGYALLQTQVPEGWTMISVGQDR